LDFFYALESGQAAVGLALVFDRVDRDRSKREAIANMPSNTNQRYRVGQQKDRGIDFWDGRPNHGAKACTGFDLSRLRRKAQRVLKPDGVVAASDDNLLRSKPGDRIMCESILLRGGWILLAAGAQAALTVRRSAFHYSKSSIPPKHRNGAS